MPVDEPAGWLPEQAITPGLAAPVIAQQFPALAGLPVRAFGQGWDNAVLSVGERWLFRFVHRAIAIDGSRRERAVLQEVGPLLPLPVPLPSFVGRPTPELPWPFWGAERLPGVELAEVEREGPGAVGLVGVAGALGAFLRELHQPRHAATAVALDLPVDPIGRSDPHRQAARGAERLAQLRAAGVVGPDRAVDDALAAAAALREPAGPPVLVHGDLHLRHVLVLPEPPARVGGVIDWGDTSLGDPAVDLMIAYSGFEGAAREALLEAYGTVPPERIAHARAVALAVTAALTLGAVATGPSSLVAAGVAALARAAR